MLEHVGDEYYEDFFRQCESLLADNGVLVVQVSGILVSMIVSCHITATYIHLAEVQ